MPYFLATWAVESWLPPTSEVISTSGIRLSASRCFCPNAPCPATQIFIGFLFSYSLSRHARPYAGHPRLSGREAKDVDGRVKPGHDENVLTANAVDFRARRGAFHLAGGLFCFARGLLRATAMRLQNDVPDRGVGGRHGVEAIDLVDLVFERAAHDQPHHHLDAFGAGLAHIFEVLDAGELLRVLGQVVQKRLVELAVDQPGTRPADLVR